MNVPKSSQLTWQTLAFGLVIGLVSWCVMLAGVTTRAELSTLDTRFLLQAIGGSSVVGGPVEQTSPRIVLVVIDSKSLVELGPWPWPRSLHSQVIQNLAEAGTRVIGFDLIFAELSDPAEDLALVESVGNNPPVLLPVVIEGTQTRKAFLPSELFGHQSDVQITRMTPPFPLLSERAELGHIGILPDRDGIVRSVSTSMGGIPAFSVQLARLAGLSSESIEQLPNQFIVNYPNYSAANSVHSLFPIVSYRDVYAGRFNCDLFSGSVVLIGSIAPGLKADFFPTPVRIWGYLPGLLFQAAAVDTILHDRFITPFPASYRGSLLLAIVIGVLASVLFSHGRPGRLILRLLGALVLTAVGAQTAFAGNVWVLILGPIILPLGISFISAIIREQLSAERTREKIRQTFSRYVPQTVLETLLAHPQDAGLGGKERHVAVFFADFRNFTSFAEKTEARQVVETLNEAFGNLVPLVQANGGIIDKFMGDAIMAVFGAPVSLAEPEAAAVKSAIAILNYPHILGDLRLGIGLASGTVIAGNLGTAERLDYTVVGHPVNTASRLEELADAEELLITAEVYAKLPPQMQQLFTLSVAIKLKGVSVPTDIYSYRREVTCGEISDQSQRTLK